MPWTGPGTSWVCRMRDNDSVMELVGLRRINRFCSVQRLRWRIVIPVPTNHIINTRRKCGGRVIFILDLGAGLWRVNFTFQPTSSSVKISPNTHWLGGQMRSRTTLLGTEPQSASSRPITGWRTPVTWNSFHISLYCDMHACLRPLLGQQWKRLLTTVAMATDKHATMGSQCNSGCFLCGLFTGYIAGQLRGQLVSEWWQGTP
jgi:hypothetical protein